MKALTLTELEMFIRKNKGVVKNIKIYTENMKSIMEYNVIFFEKDAVYSMLFKQVKSKFQLTKICRI